MADKVETVIQDLQTIDAISEPEQKNETASVDTDGATVKKKRGRPCKVIDNEAAVSKPKRGRPKKQPEVVVVGGAVEECFYDVENEFILNDSTIRTGRILNPQIDGDGTDVKLKKSRGRPRKIVVPLVMGVEEKAALSGVEDTPPAAGVEEKPGNGEIVKKPRGRPRKIVVPTVMGVEEKAALSGVEEKPGNGEIGKKPRGRPRKIVASTGSGVEEKPAPAGVEEKPGNGEIAKKPRGRPPKIKHENMERMTSDEEVTIRKRGRPPKIVTNGKKKLGRPKKYRKKEVGEEQTRINEGEYHKIRKMKLIIKFAGKKWKHFDPRGSGYHTYQCDILRKHRHHRQPGRPRKIPAPSTGRNTDRRLPRRCSDLNTSYVENDDDVSDEESSSGEEESEETDMKIVPVDSSDETSLLNVMNTSADIILNLKPESSENSTSSNNENKTEDETDEGMDEEIAVYSDTEAIPIDIELSKLVSKSFSNQSTVSESDECSDYERSPRKTPKKKRGRPRKPRVEVAGTPMDGEDQKVKRGRGRPRKYSIAQIDGAESDVKVAKKSPELKRKRGRPPKQQPREEPSDEPHGEPSDEPHEEPSVEPHDEPRVTSDEPHNGGESDSHDDDLTTDDEPVAPSSSQQLSDELDAEQDNNNTSNDIAAEDQQPELINNQ
ncbi:uncharacterized protein LOC141913952 [Tubulanus polymorphus]|uniref:uncharacterized protein LOC141913952 n=1 Tax=Tubulanus polymorphus TaxID=672921 RepID=UPI003DA5535F